MNKTIPFPASIKLTIKKIAYERNYPIVIEIVERGDKEVLILTSQAEAQMIIDVARIEILDAALKYPFWDDDSPRYDKFHEDAFQDVQMGFFEKIIMYIGQEYEVVTTV